MSELQESLQAVLDAAMEDTEACGKCGGKGWYIYRSALEIELDRDGLSVGCGDCGGSGGDGEQVNGTGKVQTALGRAIVLAVSEWAHTERCLTCKHAHVVHRVRLSAIRDWSVHTPVPCKEPGCKCVEWMDDGTGRTLIPVNEDDTDAGRVSRAEACGRLLMVYAAFFEPLYVGSARRIGDTISGPVNRFMTLCVAGDLPAAMATLRALQEAMA